MKGLLETGAAPDAAQSQAERRRASDARMLRAAMRIVAEKGAAGATLAEIGVAAGYSRGLPAERFRTKLVLLETLMDSMDQWFRDRVGSVVAGKQGMPAVLARIEAHIDGACASRVATAALYSLFVESLSAVSELRPRAVALSASFHDGFRVHLEEAKSRGEIRDDVDCGEVAGIIVGALRGLIMQSLLDDGASDLAALKPQLIGFVTAALNRATPPSTVRLPQGRRGKGHEPH